MNEYDESEVIKLMDKSDMNVFLLLKYNVERSLTQITTHYSDWQEDDHDSLYYFDYNNQIWGLNI